MDYKKICIILYYMKKEAVKIYILLYLEIVVRIGLKPFSIVDETCKYDDAQHQEEDEQRQFFC